MIGLAQRRRVLWATKYGLLITAAVVFVGVPLWIVVVNSLKPLAEANRVGIDLPQQWAVVENYGTVISKGRTLLALGNTLLIVVPSVIGIVFISALAAWVIGRARRRSVSVVYYVLVSGVLIPPAVVTTLMVLRAIGVAGTHLGMILFYVGISIPFATFLITGFIKTIPVEIEDAGRIDGAGPITLFLLVIFPLLRPVLASVAFVATLTMWNDFLYPFIFLSGVDRQTLTVSLFNFVSAQGFSIRWNLLFADIVLVNLPLIVGYLFVQRQLATGMLGATYK